MPNGNGDNNNQVERTEEQTSGIDPTTLTVLVGVAGALGVFLLFRQGQQTPIRDNGQMDNGQTDNGDEPFPPELLEPRRDDPLRFI